LPIDLHDRDLGYIQAFRLPAVWHEQFDVIDRLDSNTGGRL
jgi:hypothetical protein